jgi:pSer/pThr/pTyr-binding forkhead associated (FHA) protein
MAPRSVAPPESMAEIRQPPAGMPKACLSGYAPSDLRVATVIGKSSYTIGRRDGNDLVLQVDNKVGVSGRHATIKFLDGHFFIVDDKSTFGTFVNDLRLPSGATLPLEDGAIIGLGPKVKIQFRLNCP